MISNLSSISNNISYNIAEKLFEKKCSINSEKIRILSSAIFKLSKIPKIQEILSDELMELEKLDKIESDFIESCHIL